jgi:carboxyl-terminal processing protease
MRNGGAVGSVKLLVLMLVLVAAPIRAAEPPMSEADYWRATTLDLTYTKHFISNERCYSSAKYLLSCIQAVNAAGSLLKSPTLIVAGDRVQPHEKVLSRVPALAVISHAHLNRFGEGSPRDLARKAEIERQHLIEASATSFRETANKGARIDFEQILSTIRHTLPSELPAQMMLGLAISAHLKVFDAHASLQPQALVEGQFFGQTSSYYLGIGIVMHRLPNGVRIEDVFSGAPADVAGLRVGDIITAISTRPGKQPVQTAGRTMPVITDLIDGPEGTPVTLTIDRSRKTLSFRVLRGRVQQPKVESRVIHFKGHQIGYLRIRSLEQGGTCSKARRALTRFKETDTLGVILDLRGNGGGQLMEGVCVAGLFLGLKHVTGVKTVRGSLPVGNRNDDNPDSSTVWLHGHSSELSPLPLVVLINANTASGAEIVAGALQYYKRGWVVGERSYGKASVQTLSTMDDNDTLALAQTTARFYLPNGMTVQRVGITPDFEVPFSKGDSPADRFEPREADQFPDGLPALNAALPEIRPAEVVTIRSCVEDKTGEGKPIPPSANLHIGDYQLAYALGALACNTYQDTTH